MTVITYACDIHHAPNSTMFLMALLAGKLFAELDSLVLFEFMALTAALHFVVCGMRETIPFVFEILLGFFNSNLFMAQSNTVHAGENIVPTFIGTRYR